MTFKVPYFLEIGEKIIEKIGFWVEKREIQTKKTLIVRGQNSYELLVKEIEDKLGVKCSFIEVRGNSKKEVEKLTQYISTHNISLLLGVGGGKVIDVTKYSAYLTNIPYISFPTSLSHDGICSPISVIDGQSVMTTMPIGVIVDLGIIKLLPSRYIQAGIGELVSNLSAIEDWKIAEEEGEDRFNGYSALLSQIAVEGILKYEKIPLYEGEFLITLTKGLILSGISMSIAGSSRPCSGGEHKISHAIDRLFTNKKFHGEQVGMATLYTLYLQKKEELVFKVKKFMKTNNLVYNYKQLNLTEDEFVKAIEYAPCVRKRYTILEKRKYTKEKIKEVVKKIY